MAQLPMFCDKCGAMSLSELDFAPMRLFAGNISTSCDVCGTGTARVEQGVYDIGDDSFTLLAGSERTVEQLKRFAEIMRRAQREGYTAEQFVSVVDQEVPEFSELARKLPRDNVKLLPMLTFLLAMIHFLADQGWNFAEYRQSERHHRENMEAAAEQTRHSSDTEMDALLRRILQTPPQTPGPKNPTAPDSAALQSKGPQVPSGTESQTVFRDQSIDGVRIVVDGKSFIDCTFRDCRLVFTGEAGGRLEHCTFGKGTTWALDGAASQVLGSLEAMYHGSPQSKRVVENIFDSIRRGDFGSESAKWPIDITARRTLKFLEALHHGGPGLDGLIEKTFDKIRRGEWR